MYKYIYHYYFNVYNTQKPQELILRKERYEYQKDYFKYSRINEDSKIIVFGKTDRRRLDTQTELNTVLKGKSVYLMERNDELALQIFKDSLNTKIKKLQDEQEKVKNVLSFVEKGEFNLEGN